MALFDTSVYPSDPSKGFFHDETSIMGRGSVLLGGSMRSGNRFHASILAGAGGQYEFHDYLSVDQRGQPPALSDTDSLTAQENGRLQIRWQFVPDWLTARVRLGVSNYALKTETSTLEGTGSNTQFVMTTHKSSQIEIRSVGSIHLDNLAFLGISPFLYGGVDYYRQSGTDATSSTTVPSRGVGLFKQMD
jgi:hypothetical protein